MKLTSSWLRHAATTRIAAAACLVVVGGAIADPASAATESTPPGSLPPLSTEPSPAPVADLVAAAMREQFADRSEQVDLGTGAESVPPAAPPPPPAIDAAGRTPSGWLTPVNHYWLSAHFGEPGPWASGHHTGLDFVAPQGTPVRTPLDGVVVAAAPAGAYGNLLQIRIGRDTEVWFAHLRRFTVAVGEHVTQGQVVARLGVTGHTTGPHVHFEVRTRGRARNPERFLWPSGDTAQRH